VLDEFLEKHATLLEIIFREASDSGECGGEFGGFANERHANAATASGGLQHNRIADTRSFGAGVSFVTQKFGAGKKRDVVLLRDGACGVLEAKGAHLGSGGTDEHETRGGASIGERRILGEKTVARMDRLRAGGFRRGDDFLGVEVALSSGCGTEVNRFVGLLDMKRMLVGVRVNGDGGGAHSSERADDSAGDGAAIGDEDFGERHGLAKEAKGTKVQKKDLPSAPLVTRVTPSLRWSSLKLIRNPSWSGMSRR
jgi:hypothetical protein